MPNSQSDTGSTPKQAALQRLRALVELPSILPTARRASRNDPEFAGIASRLEMRAAGGDDMLAEAARNDYAWELDRVGPMDFGTAVEVVDDPDLAADVAAFTRAGLLFFRADDGFRNLALGDRRAVGGSGSVNRTFRHENRLMLETSRVAVRFADGVSKAAQNDVLRRHRLVPVQAVERRLGIDLFATLGSPALDTALSLLEEDTVVFAEPDLIEHIGQRNLTDPLLDQQWHLRNTGAGGGAAGADCKAVTAWAQSNGAGVRVAVIDNGFDTSHPDLVFGASSGWFRATADAMDADFILGLGGMPGSNHGTACAGMVAATRGNALGGAGVAWGSELMAISCLGDQVGTQATLARAIAYAADPRNELPDTPAGKGADIVVCSLGPNDADWGISETLKAVIAASAQTGRDGKGMPIFWACTNGNFPISSDEVCSQPDVIAVGRSTFTDSDDGSGFGPKLEYLAPGVDVLIPSQGGGYRTTTGTSFAAPCAAAVAALALARNPSLTGTALRTIMKDSCDKIGPIPYANGRNNRFGHGRVNAERAVSAANAARAKPSKAKATKSKPKTAKSKAKGAKK